MRIRTDGDRAHREDTIEQAADFWGCNKTRALLQSADVLPRLDERIRQVLAREDLTVAQKREIAATLTLPGTYEVGVDEEIVVERE